MIIKNDKQLNTAIKYAEHYQKIFGLMNWRITVYLHDKLEDDGHICNGQCEYDLKGMYAKLHVSKGQVKSRGLREVVKHELLHLLLARFNLLAKARYLFNDDLEIEDESIVRVLEKVVE